MQQEMMLKAFENEKSLPWISFAQVLSGTTGARPFQVHSLHPFLKKKDSVSLSDYQKFIQWFTPFVREDEKTDGYTIEDILQVVDCPYFFGHMDAAAAMNVLKDCGRANTFLLRFSSTPKTYSLSAIDIYGVCYHWRFTGEKLEGRMSFDLDGRTYESLIDLVDCHKKEPLLKTVEGRGRMRLGGHLRTGIGGESGVALE
ncbi:hypothetical protein PROFUN_04469 [Planoprotostelium fungivorum]|uniref:SH2 domain-containing protein n=1 Tax=Planoprotostelium fungivorum TaxID=1890364 RepID=A0A2P6NVP8_9EUKA|nr:hypothetical protein PROFUN_04469 [Planoprotostelium fungivorum]